LRSCRAKPHYDAHAHRHAQAHAQAQAHAHTQAHAHASNADRLATAATSMRLKTLGGSNSGSRGAAAAATAAAAVAATAAAATAAAAVAAAAAEAVAAADQTEWPDPHARRGLVSKSSLPPPPPRITWYTHVSRNAPALQSLRALRRERRRRVAHLRAAASLAALVAWMLRCRQQHKTCAHPQSTAAQRKLKHHCQSHSLQTLSPQRTQQSVWLREIPSVHLPSTLPFLTQPLPFLACHTNKRGLRTRSLRPQTLLLLLLLLLLLTA
jgi:hypothetical protein